jgi:hypothetical protein
MYIQYVLYIFLEASAKQEAGKDLSKERIRGLCELVLTTLKGSPEASVLQEVGQDGQMSFPQHLHQP